MMPQITSLSGIQLVQRGKKLAMGYHANAAPLDNTSHHNKSMLESDCAAFRRSKRVKVSSPEGNQDSINLSAGSKIKFIIQFQADKKCSPFPIQKSEQLAKLITSKVRRHVKPGSTTFDSKWEVVRVIAAAFSMAACEFDAKTATGFPSGRIFHCRNGTR
jgi:hypothetical protein